MLPNLGTPCLRGSWIINRPSTRLCEELKFWMTSTFSSGSSVDSIIWSSSQSFARSFCMSSEAVVAVRVRTVGFPVSGPAILQPNGIFSSLSRLTLSVPSNTQSSKSRLPMRMSTAPPKCGSERVSVFIC